MAISKVVVVDGNNLIVRIDRGVAGRGVTDVEPVEISGSLYLVFTFSDGTTETVGPVGTVAYVGQSPIVINASTISLSTVPVNLGGTGQVTANAGFNALAPAQTGNSGKYLKTDGTNSAWDLLDISTADITGTLPILNGGTGQTTANASFNALAPSQATNTGKYLKTDGTNTSWDLLDISTADITGTLAITNGGTGATTASGARTNLGLGTIATQDASAVAITGGSIAGITDLAVADGGTGASTAANARTNLNAADQATTLTAGTGLSGGGDLSANRTFSITNTGVSAASYGSASNTLTATVNAQGQLTALAATPIAIANTQISGLGTISTQNANAVAITGGSITGITDLAVADGGTGASDAAGARTNLNAANQATTITAGTGLSGGGDLSANRTIDIANTTVTAGSFGSASNTLTATVNAQGQLTALAATPIAIANTQVSGLGTLSTQNSNAVTITGGSITGITDLAIADGGTGASNAADARSNLGLGSAAVLNAGVALGVATLDAGGTVPLSQIPASIQGGVSYQGAWNASTNTPTLVSSVGSKGYYYVVSVSGNTNLNGVTDWLVGDWAIYNGTAWQKIDNTDQVASVNGYTGVVVLSNTDVGAPPTSLTISAGTGLSGGGNLTTNRTLSIANTTVTAAPYGTASAVPTFTVNGQGQLTAAADVTIAIANTQVSGLGTLSTQNANSVSITGGSITGITDLAVADGGTGASNATDARSNLSAAYNAITISAGTGLTGGGDLTANRTLAIDSSVVTLTGTQTLTNKTLTSPLVNEILDTNGNEILGLSPTASATDFVTVKNGIGTGVPLHIYADGPSTNIGLHLQPKGSGLITISDGTDFNKGIRFRSSGSAASAVTLLDAVSTAGRVVTLPDATTTLVGRDTTDTLTNKTIAFGSNTFSGSLAIANGGTGQATANAAFNALAPSQTGNSGKYLTTDGTDTSWASNPLGTVTSVAASVPSFLSIAGSPITTSGTLAISLSGTALPTTSGGTGLTSFTANGVAYASSSSALATGSALTFDGTNLGVSGNANFGNSGSSTYGGYATGGRIFSLAASGGVIPAISASTDTTTSSTAFRAYTKEVANDTSYAYEIQTGNGTGVTTQKLQLTWGANGLWNSTGLAVTGNISTTGSGAIAGYLFKPENTYIQWNSTGAAGGTNRGIIWADSSSNLYIGTGSGNSTVATFNSTSLYTASGINVGIGLSNPSSYGKFAIANTGGQNFISMVDTANGNIYGRLVYDNDYFIYKPNSGTAAFTVGPNGSFTAANTGSFVGDLTIGNYVASTNVSMNFNGVANKAKRIIFKTSGAESWLIGMGAASENDAFEIYNGNGQMALTFAKATSKAIFNSDVAIGNPSNVALSGWTSAPALQVGNSANFYGDGIYYNWVAGLSLNSYRSANAWYNTSATIPTGRFEIGNGGGGSESGFTWYWGTGGSAGVAAAQTPFMRLTDGGSLLVGTSSIGGKLSVSSAGGSGVYTIYTSASSIVNPNSTGSEIVGANITVGSNIILSERQPNGAYADRTDLVIRTNTGYGVGQSDKFRFSAGGTLTYANEPDNNYLNMKGNSSGGGISWSNYMNVFSEYSSGASYISSNYYPTIGAAGYKTTLTATYGAAGISINGTGGASNGGLIAFYVNPATSKTAGAAFSPTEVMRIDQSGNVGIGANNPTAYNGKLVLFNGTGYPYTYAIYSNDTSQSILKINYEGGSSFTNGYKAGVSFGSDQVPNGAYAAQQKWFVGISSTADGVGNSTLVFYDQKNSVQRMSLDMIGNLLLGTTNAEARLNLTTAGADSGTYAAVWRNSAGTGLLYMNSAGSLELPQIYANFTTSSAANMFISSSGLVQRSTSSIKYKKNVQNATHGLAEVLQLRPVTYEGKSETDVGKTFGGLIAEEVHAVGLTEFVQYAEDGSPDALAYGNMVSLLAKAMQEQQAIIESLKARLDAANL
jgi:hypothetical protein